MGCEGQSVRALALASDCGVWRRTKRASRTPGVVLANITGKRDVWECLWLRRKESLPTYAIPIGPGFAWNAIKHAGISHRQHPFRYQERI